MRHRRQNAFSKDGRGYKLLGHGFTFQAKECGNAVPGLTDFLRGLPGQVIKSNGHNLFDVMLKQLQSSVNLSRKLIYGRRAASP